MVDGTEELPVAEEPTKVAEEEPKENVNDLIAELEKVGIENPQQLQNKLEASAQVGKAFQMLGDERKTVAELQAKVDKLMAQPQPAEEQYYPEGRPINIQDEVRQGIRQEMAEMQKAQAKAQQASIQAYNTIVSDKNFHLVKDVWDEKVKNPAYIAQVQSGQVNPLLDYQETVVDYFGKVAQRSLETIKKLSGSEVPPAPHLESGGTQSPGNVVSTQDAGEMPEAVKRMKALQAKVDKGYLPTEEELLDMTDSIAFAPVVPDNVSPI
jgi:hypothetical protein